MAFSQLSLSPKLTPCGERTFSYWVLDTKLYSILILRVTSASFYKMVKMKSRGLSTLPTHTVLGSRVKIKVQVFSLVCFYTPRKGAKQERLGYPRP